MSPTSGLVAFISDMPWKRLTSSSDLIRAVDDDDDEISVWSVQDKGWKRKDTVGS